MADVFDKKTRSKNMSRIKGKDTKPELLIRKSLHKRGFRYVLHRTDLPGRPDVVLPKYRAVIQIHGCFWHGHNCHLFKWPKSRKEFWENKIKQNIFRDENVKCELLALGWRVITIWECSIKGKERWDMTELVDTVANWLITKNKCQDIECKSKTKSTLK